MTEWTRNDALHTYGIAEWGKGVFGINSAGHVSVRVDGNELDLRRLVDALRTGGIEPPVVIRLLDLLDLRVRLLHESFARAIAEYDYRGAFRPVFPIKVNQQRHVVERILTVGEGYGMGLEVGSKSELLAAIALCDDPDALIICNGYKDAQYVETALLARRLDGNVVVVLERPEELDLVLEASQRLGIDMRLGVRAKLAARGAGHWQDSTGPRAKFGLTAPEILAAVIRLREVGQLDKLVLLHFHLGSQISEIAAVKGALREATRLYVELRRLGVPLTTLDVGGGLGVDYTGERSYRTASSLDYITQEYANDVVYWVGDACDQAGVPQPTLVTEAGRALVAYHSVLVFEVLGSSARSGQFDRAEVPADAPHVVTQLLELHDEIGLGDTLEAFHDLRHLRHECQSRFNHGLLTLEQRALAERLIGAICWKLTAHRTPDDASRDEVTWLESELADIYYCNFSLFQSLPDIWAVDQIFPIVPLQRLDERPDRRCVLADLTCDSDGQVNRFVRGGQVVGTLPLHSLGDEDYLIAAFLVGAYQESLGDLHNLFGDTHCVHVEITGDDQYRVVDIIDGDTVAKVLGYAQYSADRLVDRLRGKVESAVRTGRMDVSQARGFLKSHVEGLGGYTYLERPDRGSGATAELADTDELST